MLHLQLQDSAWFKKLMQKLTKTEPIENEMNILLDHDYDGIKRLDNNLPPWWVYLLR
jgi:cytochrome c oxidase cbb3-type subunit 3